MEKVNVYDWDKTIFPVDSTVAFVRWCLHRHPGVIWPLLRTLALLPGYWLGKISKTAFKERMYGFLRRVPDVDAELEAFWAKNFPRVNAWYLAQQRPDDIIISASPEFLSLKEDIGVEARRAAAGLARGQAHRQDRRRKLPRRGKGAPPARGVSRGADRGVLLRLPQ